MKELMQWRDYSSLLFRYVKENGQDKRYGKDKKMKKTGSKKIWPKIRKLFISQRSNFRKYLAIFPEI